MRILGIAREAERGQSPGGTGQSVNGTAVARENRCTKGAFVPRGNVGRPYSKEERDLARPLYDRYRQIKRLLNRNSSMVGIWIGPLLEIGLTHAKYISDLGPNGFTHNSGE